MERQAPCHAPPAGAVGAGETRWASFPASGQVWPWSRPSCPQGTQLLGHPLSALLNACPPSAEGLRGLGATSLGRGPSEATVSPPLTSGIWASLSIFTGFPSPFRGYTEDPFHWRGVGGRIAGGWGGGLS